MLIKYKNLNANLALTVNVTTIDRDDLKSYSIVFMHIKDTKFDDYKNYNHWCFRDKEERDKVFKLIMSNFTDLERC